ncbi:hypothetical protein EGH24_05620 [Halonotius terrestris]|uniref:Uncharacterized protein n=1 Tax=Halonotius terrestris TaxID=2487750 RepID=A0A8J8PAR0_9EURY|nr:DUF6517 family protein [Halonotius terrestris]TQQ82915.1 hypothetical protein EGH24_05620 [Halonotius terrestris]
MYTRRRALALGALGIGSLSGCSGAADLATGDGPIEREADPAVLADSAVDDAGYELRTQEERTLEREVSAGGETRTIIATNQVALYDKTINDIEQASLFGVISTPGFSFAGQTLNPVADWENERLLELVADQFPGLRDASETSSYAETVLGTDITVSKFDGVATFGGQEFDVYIYVASVVNEGDVVIGAGGYPQAFDSAESGNIESFFTAIEHPAEQ